MSFAIASRTARRTAVCLAAVSLFTAGLILLSIHLTRAEPPPRSPPDSQADLANPDVPVISPDLFQDRTEGSGINFSFRSGEEAGQFTILETLGGGVALIDFDADGRLDVFVTGGGYFDGSEKTQIKGHPCKLFRSLGGWKFEDVTEKTGLEGIDFYSHGAAVGDYDRDGWPDLVVTGYGHLRLFHNVADGPTRRKFEDATAKTGLIDSSWSTSAAWVDINGDGFPELYVCHYVDWSFTNNPKCPGVVPGVARDVCPPQRFKPLVHALFLNEMGTRFREVGTEHHFTASGCGLGVVAGDINDDRRPDLYVGNDATDNFLFQNRSGKLEERGRDAGVAVDDMGHYNGSMGVDLADYDGTGRPSLWVTNFQGDLHGLYRNRGGGLFYHASRSTGIAAIGQHYVGFGTGFIDFDNDGWEDLVIANGHVLRKPVLGSTYQQRAVLLHNVEREGRRQFVENTPRGGTYFQTPLLGRGLAIGDLDNDGRMDLVVCNTNSRVLLLQNSPAETPHSWVGFRLRGRGHRCIVGSTVVVRRKDGTALTRFAKGGGTYLSANDGRIHFGLGSLNEKVDVVVKWSWGEIETWNGVLPGRYWQLREGESTTPPEADFGTGDR
jgi:hypothetical protein